MTPEIERELAFRFWLTSEEIRWVEERWSRSPVSLMQAHSRACVTAAKGRTLLPTPMYKLAEVEVSEGATDKVQTGVLEDNSRRRRWWWP